VTLYITQKIFYFHKALNGHFTSIVPIYSHFVITFIESYFETHG